jgi:succinate-acetate transporter protein
VGSLAYNGPNVPVPSGPHNEDIASLWLFHAHYTRYMSLGTVRTFRGIFVVWRSLRLTLRSLRIGGCHCLMPLQNLGNDHTESVSWSWTIPDG